MRLSEVFEQRLDEQVLDHAGPLLDQHRPEEPDEGPGPLEASAAVEEQPRRVALHVLGAHAGQGEQGALQAQEARLGPDELGRRPPAEPAELLLDVADELPGVGRQLLAHRVGRLDEDAERRHQAALDHARRTAAPGRCGRWAGRPRPRRRRRAGRRRRGASSSPARAPGRTPRPSRGPTGAPGGTGRRRRRPSRGAGRAGPGPCG